MNNAQIEKLYECARQSRALGDAMIRSFSGADQAESELYYGERRVYVAVAQGTDLEAAIEAEDKRWRAYAESQRKKVEEAPRIKSGPYAGASSIHHRWVSPDGFETKARHIRAMVKIILGSKS